MAEKRMVKIMLALLLCGSLASTSCKAAPATADPTDEAEEAVVPDAQRDEAADCDGGSVTIAQAAQMIEAGATVVDVRSVEDYETGHIPGAIHLPRSDADFVRRLQALPQDVRYLVYCSCPDDGSSRATVVDMVALGFSSACNIEGGYPDWEAAGYPINTGGPASACSGGTIPPLKAWNLIQAGTTVIDVRAQAQYEAGHVPGALLISRGSDNYEQMLDALARDAAYVVICASGAASHATVVDMMEMGFEHACSVEGGYSAWEQTGLPLEIGAS